MTLRRFAWLGAAAALALAASPLPAAAQAAQGIVYFNLDVGPGETFDFNLADGHADGDYLVFQVTNPSDGWTGVFFGDANVDGEFGLGTFDPSTDSISTTYQIDYFDGGCCSSNPVYSGSGTTLDAAPDSSYAGYDGGGFSYSLASVPEPATWALMLTGFGLAGAALRRRSARKIAA